MEGYMVLAAVAIVLLFVGIALDGMTGLILITAAAACSVTAAFWALMRRKGRT